MTTIGNVTSQAPSVSRGDGAGLIQNYETFLTILTTQIQYQDPMEPMDSSQFTEQLVQFSSVEQQIKSNQQLENLTSMMTASNALGVLNFVGTNVKVDGSRGQLGSFDTVPFGFKASTAGSAEITIRNSNGEIVANFNEVEIKEGDQTFEWDGKDGSGNRLSPGTYSILISAKDANDKRISIDTDTTGIVQNVDLSGSEPMLIINGQRIPTSQVLSVGINAANNDDQPTDDDSPADGTPDTGDTGGTGDTGDTGGTDDTGGTGGTGDSSDDSQDDTV